MKILFAVSLLLGTIAAAPKKTDTLKADIRADTNRDGRVDVTGSTDVQGKQTWTEKRGAIFLANIGDTDGRCAKKIKPYSGKDYTRCHNADDDIQRAEE
ncbi:hypothetical protein QQS21_008449 [Conoideocrella luteorostrata]|uniref:EF-hand domain-containing protein n=1 Tax=Conoideocrella luteorostrata TaxID=1105319 RepID=A0AAJ0FVZ9_9HYPO|nr:hypothetical protein QQS21_008449 [Conoideocrella luteorostrata]